MTENTLPAHWWKPGQSGNPGGRPKIVEPFRAAMRERSPKAIAEVDKALASGDPEHRRWAVNTILAYAWGRPSPIEREETEARADEQPIDVIDLAKRIVYVLMRAQQAALTDREG